MAARLSNICFSETFTSYYHEQSVIAFVYWLSFATSGSYRRLGLGHTSNRGDSGGEMGDYLPTVDLGTGERVGLSPPTFVALV